MAMGLKITMLVFATYRDLSVFQLEIVLEDKLKNGLKTGKEKP